MDFIQSLVNSYRTGFVDHRVSSVHEYRPELITNDRAAGKKVLTTILRELQRCDEFWFSIAFITTGGVAALMNTLIELEHRGVKGKILASQYLNFTQPAALQRIKRFKNIELRIDTLNKSHSKGYLFRRKLVQRSKSTISLTDQFSQILSSTLFRRFLQDNINFSIQKYSQAFNQELYQEGFTRYQKYTRKDVFRILGWAQNPMAQNVGGYMVSKDKSDCAIFVNYHKAEDISDTTKYDDGFVSPDQFKWMSKSKRKLTSPDIQSIRYENPRLPLFVKKSNVEGDDFYYMGELQPIDDSFTQSELNGFSVVKVLFDLDRPVDEELYRYLTEDN